LAGSGSGIPTKKHISIFSGGTQAKDAKEERQEEGKEGKEKGESPARKVEGGKRRS